MQPKENSSAAILGFGIEGKDLYGFLSKKGLKITILDQLEESKIDLRRIKRPTNFVCGKNYLSNGLTGFDAIFRSPGVYRFLPEIIEAENNGVEVSSATKLFFDLCPAKIIGITGTKGKGTTATLVYKILKLSGKRAFLAGNIGKAPLALLSKLTKNDWVILELSSFQLIDLRKSPNISVVLNITSDHLNWHKNLKEYIEAKKNIVKYQNKNDFAVINSEYRVSKSFIKETKAKILYFSKKDLKEKYKKDLLLRGEHNLENIAAAVRVSEILKIDEKIIENAVKTFKGLEHRLELVDEVDGVTFYNDSFATGPQPSIAAIKSFSEPETIILGGYDKGLNYKKFGNTIANTENVLNVILIGDLANKLARILVKAKFKGRVTKMERAKMQKLVKRSYLLTPKGGIVILSPAAASFDMFKDYKDRGTQFKEAVFRLKQWR